jgi:membrane protease YdiL (CAAX protease family)
LPPPAFSARKDANVQVSPSVFGLLTVMFAGLLACGWSWLIAAARAALALRLIPEAAAAGIADALRQLGVAPRLPLIEWSPRRPVPWALLDLGLLVGIWVAVQLALGPILREFGWRIGADIEKLTPSERQDFILANIALSLGILAIGLPLIALRTGARPRDFGWSRADFFRDLRLGLIGLVMLAPPVYALQALLVSIWKPSSHPMVEMFKDAPDRSFFAVLFIAAALVAPLFEELVFRVLLQGFLERAFTHQGPLWELLLDPPRTQALLPGTTPFDEQFAEATSTSQGLAPAELPPVVADLNPYAAPHEVQEGDLTPLAHDSEQPELRGPPAWCAIAISAVIFALLHYNHGPDWVPLIFLAAGMGYLYQRTHRLVPSLVVHFGLNGLSMWMLWVHIYEGLGAGAGG